MACLLDLRLHSLSGLPRSGGFVELRLPNTSITPAAACFAGEAFLGAWTRRSIPPGQDLHLELSWWDNEASKERLHAAGSLQLAARQGASIGQEPEWEDLELPLAWHASDRQKAEAVDAGALAGGIDGEWGSSGGVGRLRLRLSYRLLPPAVAAAEPAPSRGVAELSGEPIEMPVTQLPRRAHTYAHGGFMGLAASLMAEAQWRGILQAEDKFSFEKANKLYFDTLSKLPRPNKKLAKLMLCLENSPVLCAYGLVRAGSTVPLALSSSAGQLAASKALPAVNEPAALPAAAAAPAAAAVQAAAHAAGSTAADSCAGAVALPPPGHAAAAPPPAAAAAVAAPVALPQPEALTMAAAVPQAGPLPAGEPDAAPSAPPMPAQHPQQVPASSQYPQPAAPVPYQQPQQPAAVGSVAQPAGQLAGPHSQPAAAPPPPYSQPAAPVPYPYSAAPLGHFPTAADAPSAAAQAAYPPPAAHAVPAGHAGYAVPAGHAGHAGHAVPLAYPTDGDLYQASSGAWGSTAPYQPPPAPQQHYGAYPPPPAAAAQPSYPSLGGGHSFSEHHASYPPAGYPPPAAADAMYAGPGSHHSGAPQSPFGYPPVAAAGPPPPHSSAHYPPPATREVYPLHGAQYPPPAAQESYSHPAPYQPGYPASQPVEGYPPHAAQAYTAPAAAAGYSPAHPAQPLEPPPGYPSAYAAPMPGASSQQPPGAPQPAPAPAPLSRGIMPQPQPQPLAPAPAAVPAQPMPAPLTVMLGGVSRGISAVVPGMSGLSLGAKPATVGSSSSHRLGSGMLRLPSAIGRIRNKRLEEYLDSLDQPNAFGYRPVALEWDLWVHPTKPANLLKATVDHGTAGQLVTQAITTAVPGMKLLAQKAGKTQIVEYGVSPVFWMNALGHAVNQAVNGDRDKPLPLLGQPEEFYKLTVMVQGMTGGAAAQKGLWDGLYVKAWVDCATVVPPTLKSRKIDAKLMGDDFICWNEDLQFYPMPLSLEKADLVLQVRGDPKGIRRDKCAGMARVPLLPLLRQNPHLLQPGSHTDLEVALGPKTELYLYQKGGKAVTLTEDGTLEDENAGGPEEDFVGAAQGLPAGSTGDLGTVKLRFSLGRVGTLAAAESMGVTPAAAQTCHAMLSKPGGLYLDIKSAYSSSHDIKQMVSALMGIGVYVKAVCSFKPQQLDVGGLADTVLFFHGISGLENCCDDGQMPRGQFVLFNGAALLADLKPDTLKTIPTSMVCQALSESRDYPVDSRALRKYIALHETYEFAGGIYIQEPDASAAAVSALTRLVAMYPESFPLGFAYGHLPGLGPNMPDLCGRGFASQELMEELQASSALNNKAMNRIKTGQLRNASLFTVVAWGQRILSASTLGESAQQALITLLSHVSPDRNVAAVIEEWGGVRTIFLRFFEGHQVHSAMTQTKALLGGNFGGKADPCEVLMALLRDRGVLAAKPLPSKLALADFFYSQQLQGLGLTVVLKKVGMHQGLHKLPREGLLCLLESCTRPEFDQVLAHLGGRWKVEEDMHGRGSGRSAKRLLDIDSALAVDPGRPAYLAHLRA